MMGYVYFAIFRFIVLISLIIFFVIKRRNIVKRQEYYEKQRQNNIRNQNFNRQYTNRNNYTYQTVDIYKDVPFENISPQKSEPHNINFEEKNEIEKYRRVVLKNTEKYKFYKNLCELDKTDSKYNKQRYGWIILTNVDIFDLIQIENRNSRVFEENRYVDFVILNKDNDVNLLIDLADIGCPFNDEEKDILREQGYHYTTIKAITKNGEIIYGNVLEEKIEAANKNLFPNKSNLKITYVDYQKTDFITDFEKIFYKNLYATVTKISDDYCIIAKLRLADLVEGTKNFDKNKIDYCFEKIAKKHIDFAICKKSDLEIKLLIEFDDSSHESEKAKENDQFKNDVLKYCGYTLYRFVMDKNDSPEQIEQTLRELLKI